jgi:hypothetical protein
LTWIYSLAKAVLAALQLPLAKKLQQISLATVPSDNQSLSLENQSQLKPIPVNPIPALTNSNYTSSWMYHQSAPWLIGSKMLKLTTELMPTKLTWDAIKSIQPWQQGWGS